MKKYSEKKLWAALVCGALSLGSANYVAAGQAEAPLEEFSLDDYVVTANRMKVREKAVAADVTVVTSEDIAKGNFTTVTDALRDKGINVKTNTTGSYVELNGDNRVLLMVNGRRTNWNHGPLISGVNTGLVDLDSFQIDNIERIEVVHGPNSSLYGNAAMGGAINIITKRPEPGQHLKVRSEIGTQGLFRGALRAEGGDDSVTYALTASREVRGDIEYNSPARGNLTIPDTGMNRTSEALTLDKKFKNGDLLSFDFENTDANKSSAVGVADPNTAVPVYRNARTEETVRSLALTYTWAPQWENAPQDFLRIYQNQETIDGRMNAAYQDDLRALGAEYQKNWRLSDKNTLISGVAYNHESIQEENDGSLDRSAATTSLYIEDNWRFDKGWLLNFGTRWENHSDFGADFTSHIGVNKEFSQATSAYISWGQAVNNPTLKMRYANTLYWEGNPDLKQEKSETVTVGVKSKLSAATNLDLSMYYSKVNDALDWIYTDKTRYYNVADETRRGLAINLRHRFSPQWSVRLGYAYAQVEESGTTWNNLYRKNNQPNRYLLGLGYQQDKWEAEATLQHVSGRVTGANAFLDSQYTTLDMVVNYRCSAATKLYLKGYNLTNASYESIAASAGYYMAPGRSVVVGLQHEF
ncbi:MAG: TonB-dependent receptor [Selenomonas ruminantium]|jgi:vitamin B12 transporter|nr:TonB-dependent receptor [Selenomonas ruminantium]